jgi:lipoprotein-anchoring transpeptidase ErfK/SrfK
MAFSSPWRPRGATRSFLAVAVAALTLTSPFAASPGTAQPRVNGATVTNIKPKAAEAPPGPLLAVVSIARQRIQVYDADGLVTQSPVSSGMPGYRTPTGVFSILQRSRFHRSNIYSNAPMPYMQRLTWSGVALHAGVLPGYPASHGCIRLPHHFAVELWGMTRIGTRVVVVPDDASPLPIEHARLPAPKLTPVSQDDGETAKGRPQAFDPEPAAVAGLKVADAHGEMIPPRARLLDPMQRAKANRALAAADAAATTKAAKLAAEAAAAKAAAARKSAAALHDAELTLAAAHRRNAAAARVAEAMSAQGAVERAAQSLAAAESNLADARRAADEARLMQAALSEEALAAAAAAVEAENGRREAAAAVKAAERAVEPISIFVSRKAGRIFIRQAWQPIHEAPVRFLDAGPPLGTHLYLAMGPAPDGETLRWLSVSLPASAAGSQRPGDRRAESASAPAAGPLQESAAGTLARFELPEATRSFIAERLWTGASLIVSDQAGSETGTYTDFIVVTR